MILFWNYPILKMISMILSFLISIFQRWMAMNYTKR
jgi:hypothetical protein